MPGSGGFKQPHDSGGIDGQLFGAVIERGRPDGGIERGLTRSTCRNRRSRGSVRRGGRPPACRLRLRAVRRRPAGLKSRCVRRTRFHRQRETSLDATPRASYCLFGIPVWDPKQAGHAIVKSAPQYRTCNTHPRADEDRRHRPSRRSEGGPGVPSERGLGDRHRPGHHRA